MNEIAYSFLQVREVFHLEFLRMLARKLKPDMYVLKGGVNLRLFFRSPRYSEDIDLDVINVDVMKLQDTVMGILRSPSLRSSLMTYGIRDIGAPDLSKAKQPETTQRFKTHLFTTGGEDLYTKIECSRRGAAEGVCVEHVDQQTLRRYRLTPFICPHYGAQAAFLQKINALAGRVSVQARDIFDLFLLGEDSLDHRSSLDDS